MRMAASDLPPFRCGREVTSAATGQYAALSVGRARFLKLLVRGVRGRRGSTRTSWPSYISRAAAQPPSLSSATVRITPVRAPVVTPQPSESTKVLKSGCFSRKRATLLQ
jgi:hypothetical protein